MSTSESGVSYVFYSDLLEVNYVFIVLRLVITLV